MEIKEKLSRVSKSYNNPIKLAIGLPVYNGGCRLDMAIKSIINQDYQDFILFISDNSSNDETENICRRYVKSDNRVYYYRQNNNIGAVKNFKFVLDSTDSEYFMWAGADDIRSRDFISKNIDFLVRNPSYVASISNAFFHSRRSTSYSIGCESLTGNSAERFIKSLHTHSNARNYSIFKRSVLCNNQYISAAHLGADWNMIQSVLMQGEMNCLNEGFIILGDGGISNDGKLFRRYRRSVADYFLPLNQMSIEAIKICRDFDNKNKAHIIFRLIKINIYNAYINFKNEIKILLKNINNEKNCN